MARMEHIMSKWTADELECIDTESIVSMLNEYQDMVSNPTYTHRNGESTPPTEDGWYWIEWRSEIFTDEWSNEYNGWSNHPIGGRGNTYPNEVRFYGPIPMPQRKAGTS
jgi:hypothetical protein